MRGNGERGKGVLEVRERKGRRGFGLEERLERGGRFAIWRCDCPPPHSLKGKKSSDSLPVDPDNYPHCIMTVSPQIPSPEKWQITVSDKSHDGHMPEPSTDDKLASLDRISPEMTER